MLEFHASAVAFLIDEPNNIAALVLSEREDADCFRLEIQTRLRIEPEDENNSPIPDTYCLCVENGQNTYGGVTDCFLRDDSLEIWLTEEASSDLGVDGGILISFPQDRLDILVEGLSRIAVQFQKL